MSHNSAACRGCVRLGLQNLRPGCPPSRQKREDCLGVCSNNTEEGIVILKVGMKLRSQVSDTEVIIVNAPANADIDIRCGGHLMIPADQLPNIGLDIEDPAQGDAELGKRYSNSDRSIELLVVKAGTGSFEAEDVPLTLRPTKLLPASD